MPWRKKMLIIIVIDNKNLRTQKRVIFKSFPVINE